MSKKTRKTLVLLDTHAIIHRAYHAIPNFTNSSGEPTGALYGLISMLIGIIKQFNPDHIIAAYDLPGKTFRHEAYDEYKGGRKKSDPELVAQLQSSRLVCEAFGIPIYDLAGFEADDMLGTISHIITNNKEYDDVDIVIASGDMDTLQLVINDRIRVFTLKRSIKDTVVYNEQAVIDRYGFEPLLLTDYKGLRGDPSDNIIGVKGIGEKTATSLIQNFGTIEKMYEQLDTDETAFEKAGIKLRIVNLLKDNKEEAFFSKVLATIRRDAPIEFSLSEEPWSFKKHIETITKICHQYELKTLLGRVQQLAGITVEKPNVEENISQEDLIETSLALWLTNPDLSHPDKETILAQTESGLFSNAKEYINKKIDLHSLRSVLEKIEIPLVPILKNMQSHGVLVDNVFLEKLLKDYTNRSETLEKEIHDIAGTEFNVRSTKQLGEILFGEEHLNIKSKKIKKTKTGKISTKESVLQDLVDEHPIIQKILDYREVHKLVSTYLEPLPSYQDDKNKIHPELLQSGTSTGRFSSQHPNIQNIPVRTDLGRAIRNIFTAPDRYTWVAIDYSQIELRIAALLSQDENLLKVFQEDGDIHNAVAARVFEVEPNDVTPDMRRKAKVINFGILYGMGVSSLQKSLNSTRAESQAFYNTYFERFPKIAEYIENTKRSAKVHGYTETLFGRKRFLPNIRSKVPFIQKMAERMAINAPIQGTSADIIKLAMIDVQNWIEKENLQNDVVMILQIHDELVFEIKNEKVNDIVPEIKKLMQDALTSHIDLIPETQQQFDVTQLPLKVKAQVGKNWGEMEEL